ARTLLAALARAHKAQTAGRMRAAAVQMGAVVRQIDALVRAGTLTSEQGDVLGVTARAVGDAARDQVVGRIAPTGTSGAARGDLAVGVPGFDRAVANPDAPSEQVLVRHAGLVCVFFGAVDGLLSQDGTPSRTPQSVVPNGASVAAGLDPDVANAGDRFGSALA